MTAEVDPFHDPSDPEPPYRQVMSVLQLAGKLEGLAQAFSDDYAEEVTDACFASRGDSSLGNEMETDISFTAERTREQLMPDWYGKIMMTEYTVASRFKRRHLPLSEVPKTLIDHLIEIDEYDADYLTDPETEFGFGYEQTFTIGSDGEFEHDYGLCIYVDDDSIGLADDLLDEIEKETVVTHTVGQNSVDPLLASVFTDEEFADMQDVANAVVGEFKGQTVIAQFRRLMPAIASASMLERHKMAERLVNQLFLLDEAA